MKLAVPANPAGEVKVKPPFAFRTREPAVTLVTSCAVIAPPPRASSLVSTPGADTISGVLKAAV